MTSLIKYPQDSIWLFPPEPNLLSGLDCKVFYTADKIEKRKDVLAYSHPVAAYLMTAYLRPREHITQEIYLDQIEGEVVSATEDFRVVVKCPEKIKETNFTFSLRDLTFLMKEVIKRVHKEKDFIDWCNEIIPTKEIKELSYRIYKKFVTDKDQLKAAEFLSVHFITTALEYTEEGYSNLSLKNLGASFFAACQTRKLRDFDKICEQTFLL